MSSQQINDTQNIEALTSKISFEIIKEIKNREKNKKNKYLNLIDKSLGVLTNNGVYAYYVYIISQQDRNITNIFLDNLQKIFNLVGQYDANDKQNYFQSVSEDITKLLFLKQLLEKVLIYARYHAKALEGGKDE